jgi:hypothetical protein
MCKKSRSIPRPGETAGAEHESPSFSQRSEGLLPVGGLSEKSKGERGRSRPKGVSNDLCRPPAPTTPQGPFAGPRLGPWAKDRLGPSQMPPSHPAALLRARPTEEPTASPPTDRLPPTTPNGPAPLPSQPPNPGEHFFLRAQTRAEVAAAISTRHRSLLLRDGLSSVSCAASLRLRSERETLPECLRNAAPRGLVSAKPAEAEAHVPADG